MALFGNFVPQIAPRFWNSIAIDRSQAVGAAINLATIAQAGPANGAAKWLAKQGAGAESAGLEGGAGFPAMQVNIIGGVSYRVLQFAMPIVHGAGVQLYDPPPCEAAWSFDALLGGAGGAGIDTAVQFVQTDGSAAPGTLGAGGSRGFAFVLAGGSCVFHSSSSGDLLSAPTLQPFYRCRFTIRNAHIGQDATITAQIDGASVSGTFQNLLGYSSYVAGRMAYVPLASADGAGSLYVGPLQLGVGALGAA